MIKRRAYYHDGGYVYFIVCGETGLVKIGYTSCDPAKRLKQLQTGSAGELLLLSAMPGTEADEKSLHAKFSSSRVRGEWFDPCKEIMQIMALGCLWSAKIALERGINVPEWQVHGVHAGIEMGLFPQEIADSLI